MSGAKGKGAGKGEIFPPLDGEKEKKGGACPRQWAEDGQRGAGGALFLRKKAEISGFLAKKRERGECAVVCLSKRKRAQPPKRDDGGGEKKRKKEVDTRPSHRDPRKGKEGGALDVPRSKR